MFVGKFHIFDHDDGKILIFCNSRILFTKSFEIIHKVRFRRPTVRTCLVLNLKLLSIS